MPKGSWPFLKPCSGSDRLYSPDFLVHEAFHKHALSQWHICTLNVMIPVEPAADGVLWGYLAQRRCCFLNGSVLVHMSDSDMQVGFGSRLVDVAVSPQAR
jgi:hypothetical protein